MTVISDSDRRVGRILASARQAAGWSREALAPAIGLNSADLALVEAGQRRLQTVEMLRASSALQTSVEPLVEIITGGDLNAFGKETSDDGI